MVAISIAAAQMNTAVLRTIDNAVKDSRFPSSLQSGLHDVVRLAKHNSPPRTQLPCVSCTASPELRRAMRPRLQRCCGTCGAMWSVRHNSAAQGQAGCAALAQHALRRARRRAHRRHHSSTVPAGHEARAARLCPARHWTRIADGPLAQPPAPDGRPQTHSSMLGARLMRSPMPSASATIRRSVSREKLLESDLGNSVTFLNATFLRTNRHALTSRSCPPRD
jgi:hypothetical protein